MTIITRHSHLVQSFFIISLRHVGVHVIQVSFHVCNLLNDVTTTTAFSAAMSMVGKTPIDTTIVWRKFLHFKYCYFCHSQLTFTVDTEVKDFTSIKYLNLLLLVELGALSLSFLSLLIVNHGFMSRNTQSKNVLLPYLHLEVNHPSTIA